MPVSHTPASWKEQGQTRSGAAAGLYAQAAVGLRDVQAGNAASMSAPACLPSARPSPGVENRELLHIFSDLGAEIRQQWMNLRTIRQQADRLFLEWETKRNQH